MQIEDVLQEARRIWGDQPMTLDQIVVAIGVVYGDLCRQVRATTEGGAIDETEVKKEMGNLIFSLIRWCDDLGYEPEECIGLAQATQKRYIQRSAKAAE